MLHGSIRAVTTQEFFREMKRTFTDKPIATAPSASCCMQGGVWLGVDRALSGRTMG
jgi:hypothetical protein